MSMPGFRCWRRARRWPSAIRATSPSFERLRRALEADRYGLVAHVLTTRGCGGADCAELRLLRDPARVVANMKARTFEASRRRACAGWPAERRRRDAVASAPPASPAPPITTGAGSRTPALPVTSGGPGAPGSSKFDFPSANFDPGGQHHERGARRAAGGRSRGPRLPPKRPAAPRRAARPRARRRRAPLRTRAAASAPHPAPPPRSQAGTGDADCAELRRRPAAADPHATALSAFRSGAQDNGPGRC